MNHQAIVAKIDSVVEIPGADRIQVAYVLGEQVIVAKELQPGYIGVLFPAELQLSEEFCHHNNLFRHKEKNADIEKAGFFDDNRRVRVQPFLKIRSQAYFTSFDSLSYIGNFQDLEVGTRFDELNGRKICQKYISEATREAMMKGGKSKLPKQSLTPYFEKHVDSEQFKHCVEWIPKGALLHFHAKIHGTSARMALTKVSVALNPLQRFINRFVPVFSTEKWDYVVGTRNVVLSTGEKEGFHGSEQFRFDVLEELKPHLEKGMTVYGEIAGFANGKPIMGSHDSKATKDKEFTKKYGDKIVYRYGCAEHEYRFHVYRITYLNHEGKNVDFTQAQLDDWCTRHNFLGPVEIASPIVYDGDVAALRAKVEALTERPECLSEDYVDPSHPGEGIIIRSDAGYLNPTFYKSKAYHFRCMEGITEAVDAEDAS